MCGLYGFARARSHPTPCPCPSPTATQSISNVINIIGEDLSLERIDNLTLIELLNSPPTPLMPSNHRHTTTIQTSEHVSGHPSECPLATALGLIDLQTWAMANAAGLHRSLQIRPPAQWGVSAASCGGDNLPSWALAVLVVIGAAALLARSLALRAARARARRAT